MSFLNTITFNSHNQDDSGNNNYSLSNIDTNVSDIAILDGQQRLTVLYVSFYGNLYIRQKMHEKRIEV